MTTLTYAKAVRPYQPLLERLAELHQIPVVIIHEIARLTMLRSVDPIRVDSEPFSFDLGGVPDPYANVDIGEAWIRARADAKRGAMLLERECSLSTLLSILRTAFDERGSGQCEGATKKSESVFEKS